MEKNIQQRIIDLKAMHRIIQSCNNEEIYWAWASYGWIPDEPCEEDFHDVAENDEWWKETCDRFGRYVKWALEDGGFYFDSSGSYITD